MPDTLADITLRHSRDLSALQTDCRRRIAEIDQRLADALRSVAAARPALAAYDQACAEATITREKTVSQADATLAEAETLARSKRSDELADVQQRYLAADRAADDTKQTAQRKADAEYQAALDEIDRAVPLDKQAAERRRAFEKHQRTLAAADAEWKQTVRADRDKQQADLTDALERERRALDQAAARRASAATAAEAVYQQGIKVAHIRLTADLSSVPEVATVQADFGRRREAIQKDCQVREDKLFEVFREALKKLQGD